MVWCVGAVRFSWVRPRLGAPPGSPSGDFPECQERCRGKHNVVRVFFRVKTSPAEGATPSKKHGLDLADLSLPSFLSAPAPPVRRTFGWRGKGSKSQTSTVSLSCLRKHVEAADISAHPMRERHVLHPISMKKTRQLEKKNAKSDNTCALARTLAACRALKTRRHVEARNHHRTPVIPRGRDVSAAPDVVFRPFSVKEPHRLVKTAQHKK